MIDRAVVVVKPGLEFLDWINEVEEKQDLPDATTFTLAQVQNDAHTYLVPEQDEVSDIQQWLDKNGTKIFENELKAWCQDESLWPKQRESSRFKHWCEIEVYTMVFDFED